jgi:D-beta-D-heptose 7-phosphate kinase/D-beta-D-heptose 1-phosphate adenosyltransferase
MDKIRYEEIVRGFTGRSVLVLGDLMMDEYLWGRATRISPESPVMVVDVDRESSVPGGAANVVNNILALGGRVGVLGVVGDDEKGIELRSALESRGADVRGIITDSTRPTTRKTRIVAHNQQVMRVDREQTDPISEAVADQLIKVIQESAPRAQAVIISDYNKGVLAESVARAAVAIAREHGVTLTANPKPPNAQLLAGADVVSLNQSEAESVSAAGRFKDRAAVEAAGPALVETLRIESLVITQGSRGLSVFTRKGEIRHIEAHPVEVYDVAGAGDTVISAMTLGIAAGASLFEAAEVANHAAACVVRHRGVATVTQDELIADF